MASEVEQCNNPQCAKRIRELEEELNRLRSVGYDMLKQRGNWQAGGVKPQELGLEYDSMFTHEVEEVSEVLTRKCEMTEAESRQLVSTAFQDVYETCKESILNRMRAALSRVLVLPEEHEDDEQLYDIARAYGLLVSVCGSAGSQEHKLCSTKVCSKLPISSAIFPEELKDLLDQMSQFSGKLLEMVPPLVSETVYDTPFCKEWHAKEVEPEWTEDLKDYRLVYYRPILFFSYEGKVSQKGWVGNTAGDTLKDGLEQCDTAVASVKLKRSYKKPQLKVQGLGDINGAGEETHSTSTLDVPVLERLPNGEHVLPNGEHKSKEPVSENDTNNFYFGFRTL